MRAFLAVVPPRVVREAVEQVRDPLRDLAPGGRWVHPSLWHFTLKFLGEVEDELVPVIADLASEVAQSHDVFEMALSGSGLFPNKERPRVLWIGLTDGQERFAALAEDLDRKLDGLGFEPEEKPPLPHLTVARFRDPHEAGELPAQVGPGEEIARFEVKELVLMRSVLRPRGPDYSVVERMPLHAPEVPEGAEEGAAAEGAEGAPSEEAVAPVDGAEAPRDEE